MTKSKYSLDIIDADKLQQQILKCQPEGLSAAEQFRWRYLEEEFLSKLPRSGFTPKQRRDAAIKVMLESELACKTINHLGYRQATPKHFFNGTLLLAQNKIAEILGDFSFGIFEHASFSSGASTSRTRAKGDAYFKYNTKNPVHVTPLAYKYAVALIEQTPIWRDAGAVANIKLVSGNHIDTVPKKTEVDRAIAKEPDLNMLLQRAVGTHIRNRLRKFGVNLRDQTKNQQFALFGSRTGKVATIDLKAASDSLSVRLVMDLLPLKWYRILDDLRSHTGLLPDGETITWEKFSSMGNGFTFELESLIFYAIAHAVAQQNMDNLKHVSVYGDDIIVPSRSARNLISVLDDVGFKTNIDKTFVDGPFRESCGKHYYDGLDVSPFYLRKPLDNTQRIVWLLNALRTWSANGTSICDSSIYPLWLSIRRKFVPSRLLGGTNLYSITSVASPEWPRDSLVSEIEVRQLSGIPCLLRVFQFQSRSSHSSNVNWYDVEDDFLVEDHVKWYARNEAVIETSKTMGNSALVTAVPDRFKFVPNESGLADRTMYPLSIPLFSEEIGVY